MEPISLEDLDEVDLLLTELEISQGRGNLVLCVVASAVHREKIIEAIRARYPTRVQEVLTGDGLISNLRNIKIEKRDIIIWILPDSPGEDILEALNNFRELFYDAGVPSIVFMTPAGLNDVIWKAADFWRYRGGYHVFKGEVQGLSLQALDSLFIPKNLRHKSEEELERQKRIDEYLLEKIKNKKERLKILLELGTVHILLGESDRSIEYCNEAIAIARDNDDKKSEAEALINLGWAISGLGDFAKAIACYNQALNISRKAGDRIGEGKALDRLSRAHSASGQRIEALSVALEAMDIRRKLVEENPQAFLPDLARSLNNLGNRFSDMGQYKETLDVDKEAADIQRKLAEKDPQAFLPDLARSLNNLGISLSDLGRREEALAAAKEAVDNYRKLAERNPQAFQPYLAMSLNNLGNSFSYAGQREEAHAATKEAADSYRKLAEKNPQAFQPELARCLGAYGRVLLTQERHLEASSAFAEGLRTLAPFHKELPQVFAGLAKNLRQGYIEACQKARQEPYRSLLSLFG